MQLSSLLLKEEGGVALAELALSQGAPLGFSLDPDGLTMPVIAYSKYHRHSWTSSERRSKARLVLEKHIDPKSSNHLGMTPLVQAIYFNAPLLAQIVMSRSDLAQSCEKGMTALAWAGQTCDGGELFKKILEEYTRQQVDIDQPCLLGQTALMRASGKGRDSNVIDLVMAGADIMRIDIQGRNAFHHAAKMGYQNPIDIMGHESTYKLALQERDANGVTPLALAAREGWDACVEALLSLGAPAQVVDKKGATPLMLAAAVGSDASFELLLPLSDVQAKDAMGRALVDYAHQGKSEKIMARAEQIELGSAASKPELRRARWAL
jgi:ankyrin repeat protein